MWVGGDVLCNPYNKNSAILNLIQICHTGTMPQRSLCLIWLKQTKQRSSVSTTNMSFQHFHLFIPIQLKFKCNGQSWTLRSSTCSNTPQTPGFSETSPCNAFESQNGTLEMPGVLSLLLFTQCLHHLWNRNKSSYFATERILICYALAQDNLTVLFTKYYSIGKLTFIIHD